MSTRVTSQGDTRVTSQSDTRVTSQDEGPPPSPSLPGAPLGAPMGLQMALYDQPGGRMLVDFSPDVTGLVISDGPHGYEMMQSNIDQILRRAARWYSNKRVTHATLNYGPETVWEGRLEDKRLNDGGLGLSSFGYWRAMFDAPYSGFWSKTGTADWRPVTGDEVASSAPERFEMDNNNRIFIAPRQDEDYDDTISGRMTWATPHWNERQILAVDFDYILDAPADWTFTMATATWQDYTFSVELSVASAGTPLTGTISLTFSPGTHYRLGFSLYYDNVTPTTYTGLTGEAYLKITNLRVASTTRDRINTSLGTTFGAGGSHTVTPGTMANIYVGQQLRINQGGFTGETVVVTAVTSTTFTATFANPHSNTEAVEAIVVYADEIAGSLVDFVEALNPGHINDSKALIEAHDVDLTDEIYEDAFPADILNDLIARGDTAGRRWEVGIRKDRRLFFRPRGDDKHTWYVDATSIDLERTLNNVANSVYAVYQDDSGWTLRTVEADNDLSIQSYGLTRRLAFPASTTRQVQAQAHQDAALAFWSDPPPRQVIEFDRLWTAGGALVRHKWRVRAGDTIVLRNIDPTLLDDDQSTSFQVGRVHYDASTDRLAIEPEMPPLPIVPMLINGVAFVPRELPPVHVQFPDDDIPGHGLPPGHDGAPGPLGGGSSPDLPPPTIPSLPPGHGGGPLG